MQVCPGVYALDCTVRSYAYLVVGSPTFLIDTSMPGLHEKILTEMTALGVDPHSVSHILLTHHDVDHIGNAARLKAATGATLWASSVDQPYIEAKEPRPGLKRLVSMLVKTIPPTIDATFDEDMSELPLEVIKTPGHTPGHVVFLYRDILFAGDMVMTRRGQLRPSPALMTWDSTRLKASIQKVSERSFHWICPAHGQPVHRDHLWETTSSPRA